VLRDSRRTGYLRRDLPPSGSYAQRHWSTKRNRFNILTVLCDGRGRKTALPPRTSKIARTLHGAIRPSPALPGPSGRTPISLHLDLILANVRQFVVGLEAQPHSGLPPNAFDSRTAISGEIPAFPFTRLFSAWRVTPRAPAASVIVSPSGSTRANGIWEDPDPPAWRRRPARILRFRGDPAKPR
jgi:hypothetical protein